MEAGLEERVLTVLQLVEEIDRQSRWFTSISKLERAKANIGVFVSYSDVTSPAL
jgi:hypothetical protein